MKAEDLRFSELIDRADGHFMLKGRRLVLHGLHAMAYLRGELVHAVGSEQARRLLTRYGYFWGRADAAAMKRIFKWDSVAEWLRAGPRMMTIQGAATAQLAALDIDEAAGHLHIEVTWRDSSEVEEQMLELGESEAPACWVLTAYMSGYASLCMKKPVYFIESACRAQPGKRVCKATGRDVDSWGDQIAPHLPYYETENIAAQIETLSQKLKKQQEELDRQQRRLRQFEQQAAANRDAYMEVRSASFQRVMEIAMRIARYDTSVLITGESGTGKEVLARHVHAESTRARQPFLAINCGALPEMLLESELFGHRRGSFTGAVEDRPGLFERANHGTLFLDEVGEMPPQMQVKLLRAIQEREVVRVGESHPRKVDIRIITATNRDLKKAIRDGRFREDLYYRLAVVELAIPPLRERPEDIVPLARFLLNRIAHELKVHGARFDPRTHDHLLKYDWPGNIRELRNTIEQALLMAGKEAIAPEHLPLHVLHPELRRPTISRHAVTRRTLGDVEREHILAVLDEVNGNRSQAAQILGISTATLWRRMKEFERGDAV